MAAKRVIMGDLITNIEELRQKGTKILFDANILFIERIKKKFSLREFLPIVQHRRYGFIDKKGNIVMEFLQQGQD